jgi:hypothetical protein
MSFIGNIAVLPLTLALVYVAERTWPERARERVGYWQVSAMQEFGIEPAPSMPERTLSEFQLD